MIKMMTETLYHYHCKYCEAIWIMPEENLTVIFCPKCGIQQQVETGEGQNVS